ARWRLQGSLTYARSTVRYHVPSGQIEPIHDSLGGPRLVGNLALTYDGRRLNARAAISHRGRYLSAVPSLTGGDAEGVAAVTSIDASARYRLTSQITLTADAANLTDAVIRQFTDRSEIPNYQHRTGREVRLGLRYRYR
ncbi:MAG TPA: TonB-dependent receptor, partial [Caulobacter sp.]|nr:TonB-dependent receptor [Caulobacter sp.]